MDDLLHCDTERNQVIGCCNTCQSLRAEGAPSDMFMATALRFQKVVEGLTGSAISATPHEVCTTNAITFLLFLGKSRIRVRSDRASTHHRREAKVCWPFLCNSDQSVESADVDNQGLVGHSLK